MAVSIWPRAVKHSRMANSEMWSANNSNNMYPFRSMYSFAENNYNSPVTCFLHSATNRHVSSELRLRKAPSSRNIAQSLMKKAISRMNIMLLPSKKHFARWLSRMKTPTKPAVVAFMSLPVDLYEHLEAVNKCTSPPQSGNYLADAPHTVLAGIKCIR